MSAIVREEHDILPSQLDRAVEELGAAAADAARTLQELRALA